MNLTTQIAKQFREVFLHGDWVASTNLKAELAGLTWVQATTNINSFNSIAALVFHLNYYIVGVLNVLEGGSLDIRDKYSFDLPPIKSKEDWESILKKMWDDVEKFALALEKMPDEKLEAIFVEEKYGHYHRNILAIIEHSYYHLGQIVLIKKMILQNDKH